MTQINPFVTSIVQTPQTQQQQSTERARRLREAQESRSGRPASQKDEFIPEVEPGSELAAVEDSHEHPRQKSKPKPPKSAPDTDDDQPTHIDLTA